MRFRFVHQEADETVSAQQLKQSKQCGSNEHHYEAFVLL